MGPDKGVNLSEITLCLLYDYARTGNRQSLDAARQIVERRKAVARNSNRPHPNPLPEGEGTSTT